MGAAASIPPEANEQQLVEIYGADIVNPFLLEFLTGQDGKISIDAITSLHNLHGETNDPISGLVIALSKVVSAEKDVERKNIASGALSIVLSKFGTQLTRQILQQSIGDLVKALSDTEPTLNHVVLRCILCEIVQPNLTEYASTAELGLLEKIVKALRSDSKDTRSTAIEICVAVCGIMPDDFKAADAVMARISSPQLGVISALVRIIQHEVVDFVRYRCIAALWNLSEKCHTLTSTAIILNGGHIALLNVIKEAGLNPLSWMMINHSCGENPAAYAMNCLVNLSRCDNTVEAIKRARTIDVMRSLRNATGTTESLKALFVIAFLIGRGLVTNVTDGESMLKMQVEDIDLFIEVLVNTLELRGGKDYSVGVFSIKILLDAALCLALRTPNRSLMVRSSLMHYVMIILRQFTDYCNAALSSAMTVAEHAETAAAPKEAQTEAVRIAAGNANGGTVREREEEKEDDSGSGSGNTAFFLTRYDGGTHDPDTARLAVDLLLLLSNDFADDVELRESYLVPSLGVTELLQQLEALPAEMGITTETLKSATKLLDRVRVPESSKERSKEGSGRGAMPASTEGAFGVSKIQLLRSMSIPQVAEEKTNDGGSIASGVNALVTIAHINRDTEKKEELKADLKPSPSTGALGMESVASEKLEINGATEKAPNTTTSGEDKKTVGTDDVSTSVILAGSKEVDPPHPPHPRAAPPPPELAESTSTSTLRLASTATLHRTALTQFDRPQRHVLVSYSWPARKDLVNSFCWHLRAMGYEVWRDEEGSALFNFLSGATDPALTDIVLGSYCVVVCISPEYFKRGSGAMDADITDNQFYVEMSRGLRMAYVVMNEGYHTRSSPYSVDGWLRALMEGIDWYPLWDESKVLLTASAISHLLSDNARRQRSEWDVELLPKQSLSPFQTQSLSQPLSMSQSMLLSRYRGAGSTGTSSSISPSVRRGRGAVSDSPGIRGDTDFLLASGSEASRMSGNKGFSSSTAFASPGLTYDGTDGLTKNANPAQHLSSAWSLLMNPTKETDPKALHTLLDQLGVSEPEELGQCTQQELDQVAAFMKPVPKRAFVELMKKAVGVSQ